MSFVLGDSLDTKPCVFPCKVAPAGDDRYVGCAADAAGVALISGIVASSCCGCASVCAVLG